jgi:hypothetical protein
MAHAPAPADAAAAAPARTEGCAPDTSEPSHSPVLRPIQAAHCAYDLNQLRGRILKLLAVKEGALRLEYVERLFGLPRLYTSFDDYRAAWYAVSLTGGKGPGSWKARLDFRESFYPLVDSRPPRFRGSRRPIHIDRAELGQMYFSISTDTLDDVSDLAICWPAAQILDAARKLKWKRETNLGPPPTDGGPRSVVLTRGILTLFPGLDAGSDLEAGCVREVTLEQEETGHSRLP